MKAIFVVFLCFAVFAPAVFSFNDYSDCGSQAFSISSIGLSPEKVVREKQFNITVFGALKKDADKVQVGLEIKFNDTVLIDKKSDLCKLVKTCPIKASNISLPISAVLPKNSPAGQYQVRISATNDKNEKIICALVKINLDK
ncbi:hypothetical protein CYY_005074 [Polysphondylium violaceum]|uniref:MD-2-related lipid-recognition domain-containing protein n=1 Tax=Polysphondylium violaceum TaxID=133409 RepID=A0A8J4PVG6_9MYCE|nr:hypothetical protein CYY_005074 [Polysphondylium violaceum]